MATSYTPSPDVLTIKMLSTCLCTDATPHPYHLPNFMDVFTSSIPFVDEKLTGMLIAMMSTVAEEEEDLPISAPSYYEYSPSAVSTDHDSNNAEFRRKAVKNKILAIGRVSRVLRILRESQAVSEYKAVTGGLLPPGILSQGREGIKEAFKSFENVERIHAKEERTPLEIEKS